MATSKDGFRWRTVLEVAGISAIIYVLLGAPGLPTSLWPDTTPIHEASPRAKIESLVYPSRDLECPQHDYDVHVFSASPLIIYIDGFLSPQEANHLVDLSATKWQTSTVFNKGVESTDEAVRKSEKALIDRDTIVQCVERRALAFQGWPEETFIERLWTQRYNVSGHYAHHYDWATTSKTSRRSSTFMVYLSAECTGGGTQFPRIPRPTEEQWCKFVECDGEGEGVTFKPRAGAAVRTGR
ncbi:hypothetical protein LTR53_005916 [Teratosphaeriaceae sp. CCFEE 6253]|nr:hypothetical protein LTR53_005916 [Teratosphaeriaceae sp. CCFEE 6253]